LRLIVEHLYYNFALQSRMLRVVYKGLLGLGLIMVYLYYDVALQGMRFRVV
jgi:hypothetical protein